MGNTHGRTRDVPEAHETGGVQVIGPREPEGERLYGLVERLFPICRSITGDGVRRSLSIIGEQLPLEVHEVPSGTPVFDWKVPREWNVRDAYIADSAGRRVVDFRENNLHLVSYSIPVRRKLSRPQLAEHVFTLPEQPELIPYRTSYYRETWGFCMEDRRFQSLPDGEYEVVVDSSLEDGRLTYGEAFVPGETDEEILVSAHICHPSLANDNLSGVAVATYLLSRVAQRPRRYSYRFLFVPGTIGAITWLALNPHVVHRVRHGLVLAGVGDPGPITYKKSRRGDSEIDRAAARLLREQRRELRVEEFSPYGYDERQYCSPGFDLPVGCVMRTPWGRYPEYHTSGDDLEFVSPRALEDTLDFCDAVLEVLEHNRTYRNTHPFCEPNLGSRGLYNRGGTDRERKRRNLALLWVLNLSDGEHDLLRITERADLPFRLIRDSAEALRVAGLLEPVPEGRTRSGGNPPDSPL